MVAPELPGPEQGVSDMTKIFLASLLAFSATPALAERDQRIAAASGSPIEVAAR